MSFLALVDGLESKRDAVKHRLHAGTLLSAMWLNAGGRFFDRCGARRSLVYSALALGMGFVGIEFCGDLLRMVGAGELFVLGLHSDVRAQRSGRYRLLLSRYRDRWDAGRVDGLCAGLFVPAAVVSVVSGFIMAWLTDQSFVRIKYLLYIMALSCLFGF